MTEDIQDRIFRGQCFNNAIVAMANFQKGEAVLSAGAIFEFAEALYKEGMKRNWLEQDITERGTLEKPLTEKDNVGQKSLAMD